MPFFLISLATAVGEHVFGLVLDESGVCIKEAGAEFNAPMSAFSGSWFCDFGRRSGLGDKAGDSLPE